MPTDNTPSDENYLEVKDLVKWFGDDPAVDGISFSIPKGDFLTLLGPSGCGKTTIGSSLAESLGVLFLDADDFHPEANLKKMSSGTPLDDSDRIPWLEILREELRSNRGCVLACSALKQKYRSILEDADRNTVFIMLDISLSLIHI